MKKLDEMSVGMSLFVTSLIIIGGFFLTVGALLYGVFTCGFVGMKLWAWFVVPTFGLKTLTLVQAWGISLLVHLWTNQPRLEISKDERDTDTKIAQIIGVMLSPWVILIMGWIGKTWFM